MMVLKLPHLKCKDAFVRVVNLLLLLLINIGDDTNIKMINNNIGTINVLYTDWRYSNVYE